jgi:Mg/Co/Ni transporter MgtE
VSLDRLYDTASDAASAAVCAAAFAACFFKFDLFLLHRFDPAITAVPLMTTCVDSTGLVIYFYIAKLVLGIQGHP